MTVFPIQPKSKADDRPLVSVVLPVHNGAATLAESLDSLLRQTLRQIEILVVDDGSDDETPAILRAYGTDVRVRVVIQPASGIVAALNTGLTHARADYIARLDADDLAYPGRLEQQYQQFLRRPDLVLLGTAMDVIDVRGGIVGGLEYPVTDSALRRQLRKRNPFVHSSVMMRRQSVSDVGGYRRPLQLAEDYDLWLRLAERGTIGNLAGRWGAYRRSAGSLSVRSSVRQAFAFAVARRCAEFRRARGEDPIAVQGEPVVSTLASANPSPWLDQEHAFYSLLQRFQQSVGTITQEDCRNLGGVACRLTHTERCLAQDALAHYFATQRLSSKHVLRYPPNLRTAWGYFRLDPWRAALLLVRRGRRRAA